VTGMRERFVDVAVDLLETDPRVAVVLADISAGRLEAAAVALPERVVNVGIREQLMIGVAGGMALEGMRPIAHSYAPFLVDRAFEQIKLDLVHQAAGGAVLVSIAGSYDAAEEGRTHQSPGDVALLATLPAVDIHVPGHPDEVERMLREAVARDGTAYIRLSEEINAAAHPAFAVVRPGRLGGPLVVAVGPTLQPVLEATAGGDLGVAYVATVRPFPALEIAALGAGDIVLVEPYMAGTSAGEIPFERVRRLHCLGIRDPELRRYGTGADHRRAHGLDAGGIARSLAAIAA
jgi:transketolase